MHVYVCTESKSIIYRSLNVIHMMIYLSYSKFYNRKSLFSCIVLGYMLRYAYFHTSYDVNLQMEYRNAEFDQIIYQNHI